MVFESFFDLILKISSLIVAAFAVWTLIEYYTAGRVISRLEIRIHYFRNHDGKRMLHAPPLGEPKVWEVFDLITALWIMYRARAWAKSSTSGRILKIPDPPTPGLSPVFPSRIQMFRRIRLYLQTSAQQPSSWIRRASDSINRPESAGDEMECQFFLALEHTNPEAKAIYVHVLEMETVNEINSGDGSISQAIHPHWELTDERVQILKEGCKLLEKARANPDDEHNLTIWL